MTKNSQPLTPLSLPRRHFVRMALGAAGTLCFLPERWMTLPAQASSDRAGTVEPHFFLQIVFQTGMDPATHFDARPLEMTQAGLIANYLGEQPNLDASGDTWVTRLTDCLKPYRQNFSVINGVIMATGFDGHDQNMNYLFAGDPFGGESFVPHLNGAGDMPRTPLDAVMSGSLFAALSNTGATIPLAKSSAAQLLERLRKSPPLDAGTPLFQFIRGRMTASAAGSGSFSRNARELLGAFEATPEFSKRFQSLPLSPGSENETSADFLAMSLQLFKQGITRAATYVTSANFDAHDSDTAKKQPVVVGKAMEELALVFKVLRETPFSATQSFLDVTTVMASSEFGRTMRQTGRPINDTGTDHNPLCNTVILGGKGIHGGRIWGASDTRSVGEVLSGAHKSLDSNGLKLMGRPFDFVTGRPRSDLPTAYDPTDYLGMSSVANTLYSLFGVSTERFRRFGRSGPVARVFTGLLRS